ncbi:hypothetical protein SAMN04487906_2863 [Zhouia amylolytica]|uniref:Uncharacterized protein n=1 Tax=Zhouia amylolytica TaxID=376730 RepID=A0A1I6V4P3_9FLAO|nr:hypothetical protein [Zhouia amylolytica]MCQ0110032.1 hypothetical protein [Zhouia amylolytica]SFT08675.1 hypothetical protein SAMN04487906_2863 [Zhouia amylolytica]
MENPFKKVIHNEKLPEVIKDKVMSDVAMIKLTLDMADLFAVKYPESLEELLMIARRNKNN